VKSEEGRKVQTAAWRGGGESLTDMPYGVSRVPLDGDDD